MKLIRFESDKKEHYGMLRNDRLLSLTILSSSMNRLIRQTLQELVSMEPGKIDEIERYLKNIDQIHEKEAACNVGEVEVLASLVNPPKLICLGLNYYDHATEAGAEIPEDPIIFMKSHTTIIGPNKSIIKPLFVKKLDYEAELAVVIGAEGKNIQLDKAKQHIFGYTILNDVTARDIQFKDKQWTRGKSFDTFAPLGPCVTTTTRITDPNNLRIRTWVNDKLRQDSSTKNMVFDVYEVIHHLSRVVTLEPGDIIATGTPAGVGVFTKPEPTFLESGDRITIDIEGIGRLQNLVAEAS